MKSVDEMKDAAWKVYEHAYAAFLNTFGAASGWIIRNGTGKYLPLTTVRRKTADEAWADLYATLPKPTASEMEVARDERPVCNCPCHKGAVQHIMPCCGDDKMRYGHQPPSPLFAAPGVQQEQL